MKARNYLTQVSHYDKIMENKLEQIALYRERAQGTGFASDNTKVQTTKRPDRMENDIISYIDLENELAADVKKAMEAKREIIQTIEQLDVDYYDLLYKAYIQGLALYDIADMNGKSYSWVTTMHKRALDSLQGVLDGE